VADSLITAEQTSERAFNHKAWNHLVGVHCFDYGYDEQRTNRVVGSNERVPQKRHRFFGRYQIAVHKVQAQVGHRRSIIMDWRAKIDQ
jgi:hypothetical protein